MTIRVQTVAALDLRELERLVQAAIARGWQRVASPAQVTYDGTMKRTKWQQPMWRK